MTIAYHSDWKLFVFREGALNAPYRYDVVGPAQMIYWKQHINITLTELMS